MVMAVAVGVAVVSTYVSGGGGVLWPVVVSMWWSWWYWLGGVCK